MIEAGNKFSEVDVIKNNTGGYFVRFSAASAVFGISTQRVPLADRLFPSIDKAVKTRYETKYEGDVTIIFDCQSLEGSHNPLGL